MEQNTYEIQADFGPVGNTEKTLRAVFSSFHGQKKS